VLDRKVTDSMTSLPFLLCAFFAIHFAPFHLKRSFSCCHFILFENRKALQMSYRHGPGFISWYSTSSLW